MPKKINTTFPKQPDDYDFETEYYGGYRAVECPNGCSVTWEFPRIYETPDRMTAEATCPKCGDEFTIVIENDVD